MNRVAIVVCAATCLLIGAAAAQTNPVTEHYRAYRIAIEQGNFATAETEAAAALEASEARDGDGGRTAVLALNLALARLQNDHAAEAVAPAQRAASLAQAQGAASNVDPNLAQLVLLRARLPQEGEPVSADLLAAIQAFEPSGSDSEIYIASVELADWAMRNGEYETAAEAWSIAAGHVSGTADQRAYDQARAGCVRRRRSSWTRRAAALGE